MCHHAADVPNLHGAVLVDGLRQLEEALGPWLARQDPESGFVALEVEVGPPLSRKHRRHDAGDFDLEQLVSELDAGGVSHGEGGDLGAARVGGEPANRRVLAEELVDDCADPVSDVVQIGSLSDFCGAPYQGEAAAAGVAVWHVA